jgi:hypothetical protein
VTIDDLHKNTQGDGYKHDLDWQYAPNPQDGELDFGALPADVVTCNLKPLPLRIAHGEHRGSTNGYGIRHILLGHGEELVRDNWVSVQDFVMAVIEQFDEIWPGDRANRWQLVRVAPYPDDYHWFLVIELDASGDFYRVITGWLKEGHRKLKNSPIWKRRDRFPGPG